ncbi:MAG: hypothetical protein NWR73_11915, partial [Flavobacteriales bacterium]|nr:hypothetical protein [Flavobacteriales bacterium]
MRSILVCVLLIATVRLFGQVSVFPNERMFFGEMLFNIEDGILNEGNSRFRMDAVLTIANEKIFKGYSTSTFDLLYTVRNGKLYPADSRFSLDV